MKVFGRSTRALLVLALALVMIGIGAGVVAAQAGDETSGAADSPAVQESDVSAESVTSGAKPVFVALPAPVRFLDTRTGTGGTVGPITNGGTFDLQITGVAGVPADATSVVANVTSTQVTSTGNVQVFPTGAAVPPTSTLNLLPGADVPNGATVGIGTGGKIRFKANVNTGGTVQLVADVTGYYVSHQHSDQYLSAVVSPSGTLVRGTSGTSVTRITNGAYGVHFNRDVSACTYVASAGDVGSNSQPYRVATVAGRSGDVNGVLVITWTNEITNIDSSFHLVVIC